MKQEMRALLDREVQRWSAKTVRELLTELAELQVYVVNADGAEYQIEVQILENCTEYVHVSIAVDDGRFPRAFFPMSNSFICKKQAANL